MTWEVSADPEDFEEAIDHFAERQAILKEDWRALTIAAQRKAFTLAGTAQLQVVALVRERIAKALKEGIDFDTFRREVSGVLARAWLLEDGARGKPAETEAAHAARVELIFRNASQMSFNAGRWKQAKHPETKKLRPFWLFDGIEDQRQSSICKACDGTILRADHPWWSVHLPPLHHNCRSGFVVLTEREAKAEGVSTKAPEALAAEGFGREPNATEWSPKKRDYPPDLFEQTKKQVDAAKKSVKPLAPPTPAPAPKAFELGKHAKAVKGLKPAELADTTRDLDAKTLAWLEAHPLESLESGALGKYTAGSFQYENRRLRLNKKILAEGMTKKATGAPGETFGMSDRFDGDQARRLTFNHELGHHIAGLGAPRIAARVAANGGNPYPTSDEGRRAERVILDAWAKTKAKYVKPARGVRGGPVPAISHYAMTNQEEYFAESYASFLAEPEVLKKHDPTGYAMVDDVLKVWGMR